MTEIIEQVEVGDRWPNIVDDINAIEAIIALAVARTPNAQRVNVLRHGKIVASFKVGDNDHGHSTH
jgi:hypothetical protein